MCHDKYEKWPMKCSTSDVKEQLRLLEIEELDQYKDFITHLSTKPYTSIKGKSFRTQQYYAWEYKLTFSKRICYIVHDEKHLVLICFAGIHPKNGIPSPKHHLEKLAKENSTTVVENSRHQHQTVHSYRSVTSTIVNQQS